MRKFVTGERQSEVPMWQIGGSMDLFDIKQMTESFMEFKGFDIRTEKGRKEAIKWLEKTDGIDMFYTDAPDYNEGEALMTDIQLYAQN